MGKASTRDKILDAALTLFSEKGYDGVGVDLIAENCGLKGPSIYKHFKGKEEILDVLISNLEDYYNEKFGEQIAEKGNIDYVVLIGKKKTLPIRKGLENKNYDMDKVIVYNDVREAYNFIRGINTKEDVYALFENDLPDTYNEK